MPQDTIWIKLKYDATCRECKTKLETGDKALFEIGNNRIYCEDCGKDIE